MSIISKDPVVTCIHLQALPSRCRVRPQISTVYNTVIAKYHPWKLQDLLIHLFLMQDFLWCPEIYEVKAAIKSLSALPGNKRPGFIIVGTAAVRKLVLSVVSLVRVLFNVVCPCWGGYNVKIVINNNNNNYDIITTYLLHFSFIFLVSFPVLYMFLFVIIKLSWC